MTKRRASIVIIDDDALVRRTLATGLRALGYGVSEATGGREGLSLVGSIEPDLVLCDLGMPGMDGLAVLDEMGRQHPQVPVVLVTADDRIDTAVEAIRRGAFHYVPKPVDMRSLAVTVQRALDARALARRVRTLERELAASGSFEALIGTSPVFRQACQTAVKVAATSVTVLITGESGTGKELVAAAIHRASPRRSGPYVTVNCTALPAGLLESELFGHEKGAFTDASEARPGQFERAHGGTILLDEIGDMSVELQPKILRVLESREVERLGSARPTPVDARIIAATNQDLRQAVAEGRFRADLYYRLNVVTVELPALRDRREDIPLLATHFLQRAATRYQVERTGFSPEAIAALEAYPWPGNVRELQNAVERAAILGSQPVIGLDDLPDELRSGASLRPELTPTVATPHFPVSEEPVLTLAEVERRHIARVLELNGGNQSKTARDLGLKRGTLLSRMQKLGLTGASGSVDLSTQ
ncbi:MAG TPA: sigma-54 dependent transcriptional regulator [Armatimonadota bacterium]|mgnify:CR=1 FL=1|nr:sigma-54 dependent transcriptional regulator [Armatimonadota bacterium]